MSRDEDKPFVCYRRGWSMKIVPRGSIGWILLGLWTVAILIPTGGYLAIMHALRDDGPRYGITIAFIGVTAIWAVALIRWTMARSEMVDLDELLALKRDRDRQRRKR